MSQAPRGSTGSLLRDPRLLRHKSSMTSPRGWEKHHELARQGSSEGLLVRRHEDRGDDAPALSLNTGHPQGTEPLPCRRWAARRGESRIPSCRLPGQCLLKEHLEGSLPPWTQGGNT